MSTYNGEKYLAEQIDSILAQKDVHVELFIRDDGSSDSTRDIITKFAEKHNNIHANFGSNIGWVKSFITALASAPGYDYYAFSDQDDVWKPEKLSVATSAIKNVEALRGRNVPVMWHSSLSFTDENMNVLFVKRMDKTICTLESCLTRLQGAGLAMVFNARVRELVGRVDAIGYYHTSHDLMAMEVTYAFGGTVIFSQETYVLYRQHSNNVMHTPVTFFAQFKREIRRFRNIKGEIANHANGLLKTFGNELTPSVRKTLTIVAEHKHNFLYRMIIVFSPKFRTGDIRRTLIGKIRALLGKL